MREEEKNVVILNIFFFNTKKTVCNATSATGYHNPPSSGKRYEETLFGFSFIEISIISRRVNFGANSFGLEPYELSDRSRLEFGISQRDLVLKGLLRNWVPSISRYFFFFWKSERVMVFCFENQAIRFEGGNSEVEFLLCRVSS